LAFGGAMKRVLVTSAMALIFLSAWQALSLNWPLFLNMVFLPPIVLVFSLQNFKLIETIFIALLVGFIVDSMGGFLVGTNMLLMLLVAFILVLLNIFSGRIHQNEIIYYVMAISVAYRILLLIVQLCFFGTRSNILLLQLILGPIIDGLLSNIFYYVLTKVLILVRGFDRSDFLRKHSELGRFR
jgi:hypothetical protein